MLCVSWAPGTESTGAPGSLTYPLSVRRRATPLSIGARRQNDGRYRSAGRASAAVVFSSSAVRNTASGTAVGGGRSPVAGVPDRLSVGLTGVVVGGVVPEV